MPPWLQHPTYGPWAAVCIISMLVLLIAEHYRNLGLRAASKSIASTAFLAAALSMDPLGSPWAQWVTAGLALSVVGDLALLAPTAGRWFIAGIAAFGLAHAAYLCAFFYLGIDPGIGVTAIALLGPIGVWLYRWLAPDVPPKLKRPVMAYIVIISAMVAAALGAAGQHHSLWFIALAAVIFMLSDVGVAMQRFKGVGFSTKAWTLPCYFVAQLMFAWLTSISIQSPT